MPDTSPILEIKNATVYRKETCVFNNLSLQINQGEATAILGPNGSGKTTLLKLLAREIYPVVKQDSHIKLFGNETINLWHLRQKIGLVSHEFQAAYETLANGLEVVLSAFFGATGLYEHHHVSVEQKQRALAIMEELKLADLQDKCFLKLSTGQQRRLLLARALVHDPEVLVLDEPTAGLDMAAAFHFMHDMRRWCHAKKSLILVTHHIQEIIPEIQRVLLLKNGNIVADGRKQEVLTDKSLSDLFARHVKVHEQDGFFTAIPASELFS